MDNSSGKQCHAKAGRFGWIDKDDECRIGTSTHIMVRLDGNGRQKDLPAWNIELSPCKHENTSQELGINSGRKLCYDCLEKIDTK